MKALLRAGLAAATICLAISSAHALPVCAPMDFDGDCKSDVLWRNSATGEDYLWLMNGQTIASGGFLTTVGDPAWQIQATGDFDGDGKADILWRNAVTGENYIWLMNGLTIASGGLVTVVADPAWQVQAVGDFDGDGKADILWRNTVTGEDYIYLMNGSVIASEGFLDTVGGPYWMPKSATTLANEAGLDTIAPSTPAGLTALAASASRINLSWLAATDNVGVIRYGVYRDGVQIAIVAGTSYANRGLAAATTYSYTVVAYDTSWNASAQGSAVSATTKALADTQAPSSPTNLAATAVSSSQIDLSWSPATDNVGVTGYRVYRDGTLAASPTGTSVSIIGLSAGTTYSFTVAAVDAAGNASVLSAPLSATTSAPSDTTAPTTPTGLVGVAVSSSQINLSWTAATDNVGVTGYNVYRGGIQMATLGVVPTFQNTGLTASTNYSYTVRAFDAAGNVSGQSMAASATTQAPGTGGTVPTPYTGSPIAVPASFEAENFDLGGEGVAYHDKTPGNQGGSYRLTEDVDIVVSSDALGGGYVVNNFETGEWLAYTINVAASAQYNIEIRASSEFANSAFHVEIDGQDVTGPIIVPNTGGWSVFQWVGKQGVPIAAGKHVLKIFADQQYFNVNSIRVTAADTQAPSVPENLHAIVVSSSQIDLAWNAASDNIGVTGYRVYRDGTLVASPTGRSASITGLLAGVLYSFTVSAFDAASNVSVPSAPLSVTTLLLDTTAPTVPTGLAASAVTSTSLTLSWNASIDNIGVAGYRVYRDGTLAASPSGTSVSITGLSAGVPYSFTVSALDVAGNVSALSAPLSVTTPVSALPQILWSAGMETGNLSQWSEKINSGSADSTVVTSSSGVTPHGGTYMMKQAVTGSSGGTRVFNYEPFNTLALAGTTVYWTWYDYYPSAISFGASDAFLPWGIMGQDSSHSYNPIWNLVFHGSDNTLDLVWSPNDLAPANGPHNGESGKRYYYSGVAVPVGSWVRFEVMIKSAADFTGALKVWMNNQVLFDLSSIKTRYVDTGQGLISYIEQTGYGSGLTPTPAVHYVDDVTISLGRMP